jgi:tripartite-type tricarboxylate transporter receptor subunit TctC
MAPPGVPPERAEVLREAFTSTMKDPQFLAEAEKAKLEIMPVSGAEIEKLVKEVYGTPKATAAKAAAMIR